MFAVNRPVYVLFTVFIITRRLLRYIITIYIREIGSLRKRNLTRGRCGVFVCTCRAGVR